MNAPRVPGTPKRAHTVSHGGKPGLYAVRRTKKDGPFRLVNRKGGVLAKNHKGEPLDEGGYAFEDRAKAALARFERRPMASWLPLTVPAVNRDETAPAQVPARRIECEFILCKARATLGCDDGFGVRMHYCAVHAEDRGFRIPEKVTP